MNDQDNDKWGERLAAEGAAAGTDQPSLRRLLGDAVGVVKGRLGEVSKTGIQPLLDEAAAQVRPATLTELRTRYPDLSDDEVARRLIDRAARTAAGLALLVGGVIAAQGAVAVASAAAPPAAGTAIGSIGVTALAEVLALFLLEAKLRADLGALAGQPSSAPASWPPTSSATCRRPAAGRRCGAARCAWPCPTPPCVGPPSGWPRWSRPVSPASSSPRSSPR